jgi:hypothetical protein
MQDLTESRFSTPRLILSIFLFAILFTILIVLVYILYQDIPGNPEISRTTIDPITLETGNLSSAVKQFHPNMKFNHNNISYKIDDRCDKKKKTRIMEAFDELQKRVGVISLYEISFGKPDIEVTCSDEQFSIEKDYFIAGEGGAKEIIQTKRYNVIIEGIILLHSNPHNFYECEWPNIELHELLHVFGFDHSEDEQSLMYPYLNSCSQKLDESIINNLKNLYSRENLPDLYFEEASAVKKGRYLDFNISIKNSGVIDAGNISISIVDGEDVVKDFKLNDIAFGAGINFYVTNLKLVSRDSDNIKIIIDSDNLIEEIDEGNNIVELDFA